MKKALVIFACILASITMAYAQRTVRGTVANPAGDPVVGAYVVVAGETTLGTITDSDGAFSISNVPSSATSLVVSCIGMKTVSAEIGNGTVRVVMEEDSEFLEEVVVTAQGLTRKQRAIGYSAQTMTQEQLTMTHNSDLGNSLAGKIAGAQFWGKSGATFDEGTIILRGTTSFNNAKGSEPIYVVDGTIANKNAINMDDVESINVLKGPSATALYGSRGANGAVIVTTKKAQEGRSMIEITSTTSFEVVDNHIKFNTLYGGGSGTAGLSRLAASQGADAHDWTSAAYLFDDLGNGTYAMDYYSDENWGPRFDSSIMVRPAISWDPTSDKYGVAEPWIPRMDIDDVTRTAWSNNTNVAFSTAGRGYRMRVAFNNVEKQGVMYNSNAVRRSFSVVTNLQPAKWLNADVSYRYRYRLNKNGANEGYSADGNVVCDFTQWGQMNVDISDYRDYKAPDGSWRTWNIIDVDDLSANFHDNPYATMYEYNRWSYSGYHLISGDVYASLPQNIRIGVRLNNNISTSRSENKYGTGSINWTSRYATSHGQTSDFTAQAYATWNRQFAQDRLSVEAAVFAETRKYDTYSLSSNTNGGLNITDYYNLKASNSTYSTSNTEQHFRTRSFFGTATLGWNDLVYLDGSLRYDLDSRLPDDNNGYLYGGGSVSFMASKLIDASWLDYWKIRGSVAQVGSTISAYQIYPTYSLGTKTLGLTTMSESTSLKNPNIKPTISTSFEVGTEFKLFGNRLSGDFNFYRKDTKNDIINASTLPQAGYSSRTVNAGLVRNQGIELMLSATPVKTRDFQWNLSANFAKNVNTLVDLTDPEIDDEETTITWNSFYDKWYLKSKEGQPVGVISASSRFKKTEDGKMVLTQGNATWGGEVRPVWERGVEEEAGNVQPKFNGGFSTSLSYRNLTLSASLDYSVGGQFVSWTNMWATGSGLLASTAKVNNRGVNEREPVACGGGVYLEGVDEDGNPMSGYADAYQYYHYKAYYDGEGWIYDKTYVKLREVALNYQIPEKFLSRLRLGISRASVALVANNPWLIYSACPNLDPSELAGNSSNYIEGGQALSTKSYGITLNVTF